MVLLSWKHVYIITELEWLAFRVEMFKMREALIKIAIHFDIITRLLNLKQVLFSCLSSRACFDSLNPLHLSGQHLHHIAKSIGSPTSNERFDYFRHFHEYKS